MSRKLLILNIALVALIMAAAWRLWVEAEDAGRRSASVLGQPLEAAAMAAEPPLEFPKPLVAADYLEAAEEALFFKDRNPNVVIQAEPAEELPPLPVAHGVLDLGSGPTVILSETPAGPQRAYLAGDGFNDYTIVEVTADRLVLSWNGERVVRTIDELRPEEDQQSAVARATPPPAPEPAKRQTAVISGDSAAGPSKSEMGAGFRACKPGDTSPAGTVVDGFKKVVSSSPFGSFCRWEPVK